MPVIDLRRSPFARLRPLALDAVSLRDGFWASRLRTTRTVTLRQQYAQCEQTGRIDNFRRAAGKKEIDFQGRYYNDSDVYKWVEAASYALAIEPDPYLEKLLDGVIEAIAAAQAPDGYLNTYFTFERAAERWTDLVRMHELYCAGHLIQAAIAHHRATGKTRLLHVALRLADHICATFGPQGRPGTCGHEEIELALVELYRETGNRVYLDRAAFFLDQRGRRPPVLNGSAYLQDHLPFREQQEIVGHAVRATYLMCGAADIYAETGDATLLAALERLWRSAFERKAYITGGLGARWEGEAFGDDYELPNERAYAETCAAIGGFLWNWRMLLLTGEARYADWMETALYNGILSGISLDGTSYFYQNPLASPAGGSSAAGAHRRQPWFTTACCPPNLARLLLSLPGYIATTSAEGLWLHHYVEGQIRGQARDGAGNAGGPEQGDPADLSLRVETRYPWEGQIRVTVQDRRGGPNRLGVPISLMLRIPSWCGAAALRVNSDAVPAAVQPGGYTELRRIWHAGDVIELDLAMPVRRIAAHPRVAAQAGRIALARGPIVYCIEAADHGDMDIATVALPDDAPLDTMYAPDRLGGVAVIHGEAVIAGEPAQTRQAGTGSRQVSLTAIPYYAWANRDSGAMQVWLRRA